MARKPQIAVEPRSDGRWAVQTDGTQRPDSLHDGSLTPSSGAANSPVPSRPNS